MSDAPRWPGWTIPVVLLGSLPVLGLASLAGALVSVAAGADAVTPGSVVLGALFNVAAIGLLLKLVAGRAGIRLQARDLGIRRVPARMALVVLGFGVAVAVAAAGVAALLADVDLAHPPDLGEEGDLVGLDLATAASVLGRSVLVALAVEPVLRGFALPALAQRFGRVPAIVAVAVLGGALSPELELAPVLALVSAALCVMYLESGSIVPGMAVQAGVTAHYLGISVDWRVLEAAALGAGAAAATFAIGWSWDRAPRRS